jgi:L-seryl-tRNA(Ser) seleniumtransferase
MKEPVGRPPSVDALARSLTNSGLPWPLLVAAARQALSLGDPGAARRLVEGVRGSFLRPVVNATGVLLHTNLGRAPLSPGDFGGSSNVELDLTTGKRGQRTSSVEQLLCALTGAEAATVVNNGAAAVLLVLATLAPGRPVIVSRGELVEIGGGFRIPEVLAGSGAELVEVGTTNRTRLEDYASAVASRKQEAPVVLKVHQSNYRIVGFTEAVDTRRLAGLSDRVVVDLGSGLLDADAPWLGGTPPSWLAGEPAVRQSLEDGAAIVTFSGDKLLGGPQAGIIAGRRDLVRQCAAHPLYRALRPGGTVLSALQAVLVSYAEKRPEQIPFWAMATASLSSLRERASAIAKAVGPPASVSSSQAVIGAGSVPGKKLDSVAVSLPGDLRRLLLGNDPPVVARVVSGVTLCDLRSFDQAEDQTVERALKDVLRKDCSAGDNN